MPNTYLSPFSLDDAPYAQDLAAVRRSQQLNGGTQADTPTTTDPDKGNWGVETARSVAANVGNNYVNLLPAALKGLTGDMEGMREDARAYQAENEHAKLIGPAAQDFDGSKGLGHNLQALAYQGANMVPDMVGGLGAGAVVGGMARRYARKAIARNVLKNELAETVGQAATRKAAADAAGAAARAEAVAEAGSTPAAVSARVRGAMASSDDAFKAAAMQDALAFAGRTPSRIAQLDRATAVGSGVGAGLSQIAGLNTTNAERLASEDTDQGDVQAMAAGTGVAAALSFLPVNRLLGRFGPKATAEVAQMGERFLPRVAREYAAQGITEGVTEAAQQAAQLASHAWIDKNWDTLVGSDARNEILMSGLLGGVLGGAFGAAGEVGRSGAGAIGGGARAAADVASRAKVKILESIAKAAETRRQAFKDRPAAGEAMDGEAAEPSGFSKFMKGAGEMATDAKDLLVAKTQIAAHKFGIQLEGLEEGDAMDSEAQQRADAVQDKIDEATQTGELRLPGQDYDYIDYPGKTKEQNLLLSYVHPAVREDPGVRDMLAGSLEALFRGKPIDKHEEASLADLVESGAMDQVTLDFLRVHGPKIGELFDRIEQGRQFEADTEAEYGGAVALDVGDAGGYADAGVDGVVDGQVELDADNVGDQQAALLEAGADVSETDAKIDETDFNSGINTTGGVNPLSADERMLSTKKTVDLARERMAEYKARPDADPRHIAALQGEIARALKENKAARDELVQTVLGKPSPPKMRANGRQSKFGKPFGAFVFDENPKAQDEFAARLGKPEFVALKAPVNASLSDAKPDMRRGLLNIAHATQSMASNTRTNDNVSEEQKYRDAFFKVLQNAMLARVGLDYDTLTPGPVQYAGRQKAKLAPEEMTDAEREAAAIDDIDDAEDGAPATTLFTLTQTDIDDLKGMSSLESKAERAARLVKLARKRMAAPSKENTKRRIIGRKAKELKDRISDAVRDIRLATRKAKSPKAIEARIEETIRKINKVAKSKGKTVEPDIARRAAVRTVNQQLERELLNHPDDVRRAAVRAVSAQLQRELIEGKDKYVAAKQDKKLREMADLAREDPSLLDEWMAQYAKKRQPTDPTVGEWKAAIKEDSEHIEAFAEWMLGIWRANAQRGDEGGFDERFDTPYMERPTQLNVPYEEPRGEVARNAGSRRFEFAPSLGVASDVKLSDLSGDFTAKYKAAVIEAMRAKATARDVYEEFGESDKAKELRAVRKQHGDVFARLVSLGMRIKKAEAEAAAGADATHAALVKVAQAVENQTYHAVLPRLRKENGTNKVGDAIDEFYHRPWKFNALEKYARLRRDRADYIADSDMVRELAPVDGGAQGMDVNPHTVFVDFVNSREGKVVGQFIALQREYDELAAEADAAARAEAEAARVRAMDGTKRKRTQAMLDKAVVNAYDSLSVFLKHRPTRDAITAYEAANAEYAAELEKMINVGGVPTPEAFGRAMWIADINAQRKSGAMSETVHKLMIERASDESIPLPERFRPSTEEEGKASLVEAREDVLKPLPYSRSKLDPAGRALLRRAGEYTSKLLAGDTTIKRKDLREPRDRELTQAIYAIMDNNRKALAPAGKFDAEFIDVVRQLVDGWPEDNRVVEALDAYDAISGGKAMRDIESAREAAAAKAAAAVDMSEPKPEPKTKAAKAAAEREKAERAKARLAEKEKANARLAAFNERADAEIAKAVKLNTVRDNDVTAPKVSAQFAVVKPKPKPGEAVQYDELDADVTPDMIQLPRETARVAGFPYGRAQRSDTMYSRLTYKSPTGQYSHDTRRDDDEGWRTDPLLEKMRAEVATGKFGQTYRYDEAVAKKFQNRYEQLLREHYAAQYNAERAAKNKVQYDEITAVGAAERAATALNKITAKYGAHRPALEKLKAELFAEADALHAAKKITSAERKELKGYYKTLDGLAAVGDAVSDPKMAVGGVMQQTVDGWAREFAPGMKVKIVRLTEAANNTIVAFKGFPPGARVGGLSVDVNGTTYIVADLDSTHKSALSVLAHEFGHAIQRREFDNATPEVQAKLRAAYEADLKNAATNPAPFVSPARLGEPFAPSKILRKMHATVAGRRPGAEVFQNYLTSFDEWFAEQFSMYVTNGVDPKLPADVRSFWTGVIAKVKKFWDKYVAPREPNTTFREWADTLQNNAERADKNKTLKDALNDIDERIETLRASMRTDSVAPIVAETAQTDTGHDNTKYQAMANATLEAAGVKHGVKVVSGEVNSYSVKTKTITLRDDLKGGERVEVLMHEVGHHILWNEIAKHVEGGWGAVKRDMSLAEGIELLQHGNPKLHRALMKDFNAWRSTHRKYAGKTDLDIRASRAPMLRSQRAERYSAAGKGRRATRADFTGADVFHEWVADQIARALTTQNKPRTIIESFFADIAKALRSAWDALTGGQRNKYAPYDSVDNWVAGMFDPARAEASDQVGETATEEQTETALRAAFADAYDVNDAESMKAYIKDVLRPEERLILEQALSTPAARKVLAEAYAKNKREREALADAEQGLENRIALAYPLWKAGAFKVGPKGSSAFNRLSDILLAMMDVAGGSSMAERIFTDIASGKIERVRRAGHKYDVRQVEARARGKRQQAFNKVSAAIDKVMRPIDKFWTSVGARLEATGVPALRELRSVLVRPQGATGYYDRGVTPAIQHSTGRWMQRAQRILEGLSDKHRITTIDAMQRKLDGEVLAKKPKEVQRAVKQLRKFFDDFHEYAVEAGIFKADQKRENHFPVVMDLHDDYAAQKLTEVYSDPRFDASIRNLSFFREAEGKGPASSEAKAKPAKPVAPLKTEAQLASADARLKYMEYIASKKDYWSDKVHEVNSSIVAAVEAAPSLRSLEGMLKKSEEREDKYNGRDDVLDAISYEQRYIRARMKEFGGAPAPKAQTKVEALEAAGNNAPLVPSTRPIKELVKELVDRALSEGRKTDVVFDPAGKKAKGERSQLSSFVYELDDAAIIKRFASVQSKDMAGIMAGYIEPMVRRAEAARVFGAKREKLDALLERARQEGATDADIDLAEDAVKAALGTYGADGSPTIGALSPSLAAKLHGDKARAFMEGAQAYQNARLLPLSLLSSLVDPLGIAVRTGGDMSLAYDSWKEGMRALRNTATRKELQGMLEQIGSADDMPAIAFTAGFGSQKDSLAHKVNETVFKWNGMSTWVRTTRYMAVVAAHGFLLKHGRGESVQSRRYLAELNLQPREIPRDPNNKHRVELLTPSEYKRASGDRKDLDDRLKSALQEFVDNAVLRPNSTQQPLWYSDPYMGLITQYKAFGYAIFNQIGGRIAHEWKHGNHRVLLAAMAYVPVGMMAELLREFIQYGFDGHPKRAEWGMTDYASMSAQRSGLFGPRTATLTDIAGDFQYNRTPGTSLTGPVIGQATNFMDGKNTAGDFESALPASPLWKNHINPLDGGEAAPTAPSQPFEARV